MPSPIQVIKDWYVSLDDELQTDIAYMLVHLMLGEQTFDSDALVPRLLGWFDERGAGSPYPVAVAAVMFRSSFEYLFADRFTGAGWVGPEQMFKGVIREAASDKEGEADASKIAPSAFRMLRNLPERKAKWKDAGDKWNALVSSSLNDDALREWTRIQPPYV